MSARRPLPLDPSFAAPPGLKPQPPGSSHPPPAPPSTLALHPDPDTDFRPDPHPVLALLVALLARFRQQSWDKRLHGLQDDLPGQHPTRRAGGGEEDQVREPGDLQVLRVGPGAPAGPQPPDPRRLRLTRTRSIRPQDAYDMDQLGATQQERQASAPLDGLPPRTHHPAGARPQATRALPTSPADIADFTNDVVPWRAPLGPLLRSLEARLERTGRWWLQTKGRNAQSRPCS